MALNVRRTQAGTADEPFCIWESSSCPPHLLSCPGKPEGQVHRCNDLCAAVLVSVEWVKMAIATPPSITTLATVSLTDICSPRNTTPPNAARTGTRSWTIAARVAVRPRSTLYQRTYPSPEVSVPDTTARTRPMVSTRIQERARILAMVARGTVRTKLSAVVKMGVAVPLPRSE